MMQSDMSAIIQGRIGVILTACLRRRGMDELSLHGWGGYLLLALLQSEVPAVLDDVSSVIEQSPVLIPANGSWCNGHSGMNWLFSFLARNESIDQGLLQALSVDDELIKAYILRELERYNYDFLHGAIGGAYSLLYYLDKQDPIFEAIFSRLAGLFNNDIGVPFNCDPTATLCSPVTVNLGLAHGLPSILKFYMQCYKHDIRKQESKQQATTIINYLLTTVHKDKHHCYFPSYFLQDLPEEQSRLAWCYGDLSVGYILCQAGNLFNDQALVKFSLDMLHHSTGRRTFATTGVGDAGICHGSAGVAHIYNRIWHLSNDAVFKESRDFWMKQTLHRATKTDEAGIYRKFVPRTGFMEIDYSLLEGSAGIGLVLYSYLTGDFSWDYCLMLND